MKIVDLFGWRPKRPADVEPIAPVANPFGKWRWCRPCDVKWLGEPECWCCGQVIA